MNDDREWTEFFRKVETRTIWFLTALVNCLFLALWALTQYLFKVFVLDKLEAGDFRPWTLGALQLMFAMSSLAAVGVPILGDIAKISLRVWVDFRRERKAGGKNGTGNSR